MKLICLPTKHKDTKAEHQFFSNIWLSLLLEVFDNFVRISALQNSVCSHLKDAHFQWEDILIKEQPVGITVKIVP
jgi:hypothetical protein